MRRLYLAGMCAVLFGCLALAGCGGEVEGKAEDEVCVTKEDCYDGVVCTADRCLEGSCHNVEVKSPECDDAQPRP